MHMLLARVGEEDSASSRGEVLAEGTAPVAAEEILLAIHVLRGQRVMLDADLAALYGVETKALNQAVKRNIARFPADFAFQVTDAELPNLRSQIVTSNRGGRRYLPYAFTEQGVSDVGLPSGAAREKPAASPAWDRSPRAIQVNIEIMRTFVRLRRALANHEDLARKLDELEARYDKQFRAVFEAIRQLMTPPSSHRRPIGFTPTEGDQ